MRVLIAFTFAAVTACASGHPQSSRPTSESVRVVGDVAGGNIRMSASDNVSTSVIPFSPQQVWTVLATVDSKQMLIGNTGFKAHQKLGKTLLSKVIDCGRTQGFPSADSYDVYLQVTTHVEGKDQGSSVSTMLEAAARPMAISGEYVKCSSLGTLESAIVAGVRDRLKG